MSSVTNMSSLLNFVKVYTLGKKKKRVVVDILVFIKNVILQSIYSKLHKFSLFYKSRNPVASIQFSGSTHAFLYGLFNTVFGQQILAKASACAKRVRRNLC